MIIRIGRDGRLTVEEPDNFRKFKVAVDQPESRLAEVAKTNPTAITFDDVKTAWVSIASLRTHPGLADSQAWHDGLSAMIKAAAPHGWISPDQTAIKAHVEWSG